MVALILVFVIGLAVFRASRVAAVDAFPPAKAFRQQVAKRYGDESWQAYLIECMWCAPVWVSGAFTFGYDLADLLPGVEKTHVPVPLFVFLGAAAVASLVHVNLDGD